MDEGIWYSLLLGFIIGVVIMFIVAYLIYWGWIMTMENRYLLYLQEYCDSLPPITYRNPVYIPGTNGVYEKRLADGLYDLSMAVSNANCPEIIDPPMPPGFESSSEIIGIDPYSGNPTMFAYIFTSPINRWMAIVFTGTYSLDIWHDDFNYQLIPATNLNGYKPGIACHRGFYQIYQAVRIDIWREWNRELYDTLFITGHSLGGALSTICSYDFAGYSNILVHYSFGAPRSGNKLYADTFNQRVPTSIRINNTEDIIVALPPATFRSNTYEHTTGNAAFTNSTGSLSKDHIEAYYDLPDCPETVPCNN